MRILHILNGYKPAYRLGGPVFTGFEITERQLKKGHKPIVFTSNSNLDEDLNVPVNVPTLVDGVEVWYFQRREYFQQYLSFLPYLSKSSGYLYTPEMARALEQIMPEIDVVHVHAPFTYLMVVAARAASRWKKPIVYQQHGVFDPGRLSYRSWKKRLYIRLIERPIMRGAKTLLALTEAEADSYRMLGVSTHCEVVPNGVDTEKYSGNCDWSLLPEEIGPDNFVILFMSRMHPQKGADRLLDAFLSCYKRLPNPVLVLAGPDEHGFRKAFEAQVAEGGATNRVLFPGTVTGEAKKSLLARANLFCLPSDGEGFSMSILEALAASTPVLISPGCHFSEIEESRAGIIVEPQAKFLAEALVRLAANPVELNAMGERGRRLVEQRYRWDHVVDQLLALYENAISRNASAKSLPQHQSPTSPKVPLPVASSTHSGRVT